MKFSFTFGCILAVLTIVAPLEVLRAQGGAIILIDRTGSMTAIRPVTEHTRCADARTIASVDVNAFFAFNPGGQVAVWTFRNNGYTDVTGGFVGQASALAAIQALDPEGCFGSTPLAEAMCAAADVLAANFPVGQRTLFVSSDGKENNSDGQCAGPDGGTPPWPPNSWQGKVLAKFVNNVIANVRYWGSVVKSGTDYDEETGLPARLAANDDLFFQDLADTSGGGYTYHDDNQEPEPGACCLPTGGCLDGQSMADCIAAGGLYMGDSTTCAQVECPGGRVPALTNWGLIILFLLLVASGIYVFYQRRKGVVPR